MDTKKVLEDLMEKKVQIEEEIRLQGEILDSQGHVGMHESLLDSEGYPRNDIDLYKVRLARQKINCLQNDYKALLKQIDDNLGVLHSEYRNKDHIQEIHAKPVHNPFLKVTQVDPGSPAQEAGIELNDEIIQFGPCIATNVGNKLTEIADLVKRNENKIILLNILRSVKLANNEETKELVKVKLVPKQWNGHGLLGCKIVPI